MPAWFYVIGLLIWIVCVCAQSAGHVKDGWAFLLLVGAAPVIVMLWPMFLMAGLLRLIDYKA